MISRSSPVLIVGIAMLSCLAALGSELEERFTLGEQEIVLKVSYENDTYEPWGRVLAKVVTSHLPELVELAGRPYPDSAISIHMSDDLQETLGLDMAYLGDGRFAVLKKGKRGVFRAHAVLAALATVITREAAAEPWLQQALAHLLTFELLRKHPELYHAYTYRDEVVEDALLTDPFANTLTGWQATKPMLGRLTQSEAAFGFAMLHLVQVHLGGDVVVQAMKQLATNESPVTVDELITQLDAITEKTNRGLFLKWAVTPTDADIEAARPWSLSDLEDKDDDGLLGFEEEQAGTNPAKADTDGDRRLDGEEVHDDQTNPLEADPPASAVRFDGKPDEWLRLKKFKITDRKGDTKHAVEGADLYSFAIFCDDQFLYLLLEADSFKNPRVTYNIAFDADHDKNWDAVLGFRGTRSRWLGETHNQNNFAWVEWKNNRRLSIAVSETFAEIRIPRDAVRLGEMPIVLVYSKAKNSEGRSLQVDTLLREKIDLARWRQSSSDAK